MIKWIKSLILHTIERLADAHENFIRHLGQVVIRRMADKMGRVVNVGNAEALQITGVDECGVSRVSGVDSAVRKRTSVLRQWATVFDPEKQNFVQWFSSHTLSSKLFCLYFIFVSIDSIL